MAIKAKLRASSSFQNLVISDRIREMQKNDLPPEHHEKDCQDNSAVKPWNYPRATLMPAKPRKLSYDIHRSSPIFMEAGSLWNDNPQSALLTARY